MQKRTLLFVMAIVLFAALPGCVEPEPVTIEVTREVVVPQTVEVTREVTRIVEQTVEVRTIQLVEVTATAPSVASTTPTTASPDSPFKISGTLDIRRQVQIPEEARVIVLWMLPQYDPDGAYFFGEGTIDRDGSSFEVAFDGPPPRDALIWLDSSSLGVGLLFVTTDEGLETGPVSAESFSEAAILGAAGDYSVIYVKGGSDFLEEVGWIAGFSEGYSVGRGTEDPDSFWDGFMPVDPTTIEIIIDDLESIHFVNWT